MLLPIQGPMRNLYELRVLVIRPFQALYALHAWGTERGVVTISIRTEPQCAGIGPPQKA